METWFGGLLGLIGLILLTTVAIGLMQTLKIEGQKNNIHLNGIAPVAATRMTEDLGMPPELFEKLKPEYVTPGVVYLCSEEAPTGAILTAGGGAFALSKIVETEGVYLGEGGLSVEEIRDNWDKITAGPGDAYFMGGEQVTKPWIAGGKTSGPFRQRKHEALRIVERVAARG